MADDAAPTQEAPSAQGDDAAPDKPATGEDALGDAGKQALDRMKVERNTASARAKALEKELDQFRRSSMSDAEKAVAEAEAKGRSEATASFAARLVRSEYLAAAAKRNPGFDTAAVLNDLNLARFAGDDGEPDMKEIAASVERLIPLPDTNGILLPPSFDGGSRAPAAASTDMNSIIRRTIRG